MHRINRKSETGHFYGPISGNHSFLVPDWAALSLIATFLPVSRA